MLGTRDVSYAEVPHDIFSSILRANKDITEPVEGGDMLIKIERSASTCIKCMWPKSADGTVPVPYTLSSVYTASQVSLFQTSMQEIETLTCVRFIPRTTEKSFLNIISSHGCASYVGRTGGGQMVAVDTAGCMSRGIIQHEIDHALGFHHEHTRTDRDDYVTIMQQYISPGDKINFAIENTEDGGLQYDYGSVMHYDKYSYSNTSKQPTIVPHPDPNVPIGQRTGLSILDVAKINHLYQCNVCAYLLNDISGTVRSTNYHPANPNSGSCVWLIRTPSGQVSLNGISFNVQSSPKCTSHYMKIYDGPSRTSPVLKDKTRGTGVIPVIIASTNQMLIELFIGRSVSGNSFSATYSSVLLNILQSSENDSELYIPSNTSRTSLFSIEYVFLVADWFIVYSVAEYKYKGLQAERLRDRKKDKNCNYRLQSKMGGNGVLVFLACLIGSTTSNPLKIFPDDWDDYDAEIACNICWVECTGSTGSVVSSSSAGEDGLESPAWQIEKFGRTVKLFQFHSSSRCLTAFHHNEDGCVTQSMTRTK
ncbi:embryonic protein UVS.2-like [Pseudophryne corroboree]|uniref:embryonic protein UVS.2-like n=1 Tax=Pseudophryne corroboree TaxID=495146 RepID=UPI003081F9CB